MKWFNEARQWVAFRLCAWLLDAKNPDLNGFAVYFVQLPNGKRYIGSAVPQAFFRLTPDEELKSLGVNVEALRAAYRYPL